MSTGNFYVVRRHPRGGFALVSGCMSDYVATQWYPLATTHHEEFPTVAAAIEDYDDGQDSDNVTGFPKYYAENPLLVHPECDELKGHTHCPTCKQELPKG